MEWSLKSDKDKILPVVIACLGALMVASNFGLGASALFSYFVLIMGIGMVVFLITHTIKVERLIHSPAKTLKTMNVANIVVTFVAGMMLLSTLLVFASYQGYAMPTTIVGYLKGYNIISGLLTVVFAIMALF